MRRHLIWDWNGTLVDDAELCRAVVNDLLAADGLPPVDLAGFQAAMDFPISRFYARLGLQPEAPDRLRRLTARFTADYVSRSTEAPLQPGAAALLARAQAAGWSQSVLSASDEFHLARDVAHRGLAPHFRWIVGQVNHLGGSKVDRARHWLAQTGLPPAAITVIGDTTHDAEVATALGCACLLVAHGHHTRERLESTGYPVCDRLPEIAALLSLPDAPPKAGLAG